MTDSRLQNKFSICIKYAVTVVLAIVFLFPFYWMVIGSLKDYNGYYQFPPIFFTTSPVWQNYIEAFITYPNTLRYIFNSIFTATIITLFQLFTTSTAGYAFATMDFKGKNFLFITFLSGMAVPFTVVVIPLFIIMKTLGLIDTYTAMVLPFFFSGYGIFLMRQFFKVIPHDLHDSGVIDGCSELYIYSKIYMPLSGPVLITLGIQCFVCFYNQLLWPLIIINSAQLKPIAAGLMDFIGKDTTYPTLIMAGAAICVTPTLALFLGLQKYYVRGIVTTGLKG